MVIPLFSFTPDSKRGDKNKTIQLPPPPPPSTWPLDIEVTDACDTGYCTSIKNCTIRIILEAASSSCIGLVPIGSAIPFVMCQNSYSA